MVKNINNNMFNFIFKVESFLNYELILHFQLLKRTDFRNHDLVQSWYKLCKSVVGIGVVEGRSIEQQLHTVTTQAFIFLSSSRILTIAKVSSLQYSSNDSLILIIFSGSSISPRIAKACIASPPSCTKSSSL